MSELSNGDNELKDVLIQSLTANGVLPRLQAQLRAAVFLALEKHNYHETLPPANSALKAVHSNTNGLLLFSLVVEFLKHTQLSNTLEVFTREADLNNFPLLSSEELRSQLDLPPKPNSSVLATLVDSFCSPGRKASVPVGFDRASDRVPNPLPQVDCKINGSNNLSSASSPASQAEQSRAVHSGTGTSLDNAVSSPRFDKTSDSEQSLGSQNNDSNLKANRPTADRVYQDDFDSTPSPAQRIDSGGSVHRDTSQHSNSLDGPVTHNDRMRKNGIFNGDGAATPSVASEKESTTREGRSSSVVRIYTRSSIRTPSDEDKSDVDDDDDDDIPEMLKDFSVGEDSIDQTIDSDDSLGLDHVEEVRPIKFQAKVSKSSS